MDVTPAELTGQAAAELLRYAGCEPEYADSQFVVLIATPFNTERDFERLEKGIRLLADREARAAVPLPRSLGNRHTPHTDGMPPLPPARIPLRDAVLAPSEAVPLEKCVGRIAADPACPCPPGVPVVMPGEEITKDAVDFLRAYGFSSLKVLKYK